MSEEPWARRFYGDYYAAITRSPAYAEFCRRAFGADFGQHGFADMAQVEALIQALDLRAGERVLELGCGDGRMAAHIAGATGAHVVGLDFIFEAVRWGQTHTAPQPSLAFLAADIGALPFAPRSIAAIYAVDTLYFTELADTLRQMAALLAPHGRMALLYSHGANPETPLPVFRRETLPPERTPLGVALGQAGLPFTALDLTEADLQHALRKRQALDELHDAFAAEGSLFLYENRYGEALGVAAAHAAGAQARYLYRVAGRGQ